MQILIYNLENTTNLNFDIINYIYKESDPEYLNDEDNMDSLKCTLSFSNNTYSINYTDITISNLSIIEALDDYITTGNLHLVYALKDYFEVETLMTKAGIVSIKFMINNKDEAYLGIVNQFTFEITYIEFEKLLNYFLRKLIELPIRNQYLNIDFGSLVYQVKKRMSNII